MSDMRLTTEQRIAALERDNTILQDKLKLMHKMLREQRQLINDYIMQRMAAPVLDERQVENKRPDEDGPYTFVCRQRFDRIQKAIEDIQAAGKQTGATLKAG